VRDAALLLEVEAATLDQVREASALAVDRVLLDNMDPSTVGKALAILDASAHQGAPVSALRPQGVRRWPQIEVSGGLTLETVRPMAELGVDFLSVGALTHSAPALDISLEIVSLG
jgi:nicotinate-nucleotide pyrophosphorylase (carboxylating)